MCISILNLINTCDKLKINLFSDTALIMLLNSILLFKKQKFESVICIFLRQLDQHP